MNRKLALTILIIVTILWVLLGVSAGFLGVFSVFLTDSGTIDPNVFNMIFFGLLGFPVIALVLDIIAWVLFFLKKETAAVIVSLVPLLELCVPAVGFMILFQ